MTLTLKYPADQPWNTPEVWSKNLPRNSITILARNANEGGLFTGHAFIVYTDGNGKQTYLSAYPERNRSATGTLENLAYCGGDWGAVVPESGSLDGSPEFKNAGVLATITGSPKEVAEAFAKMKVKAGEIRGIKEDYCLTGPNSNTFVGVTVKSVVKEMGIKVVGTPRIDMPCPGINGRFSKLKELIKELLEKGAQEKNNNAVESDIFGDNIAPLTVASNQEILYDNKETEAKIMNPLTNYIMLQKHRQDQIDAMRSSMTPAQLQKFEDCDARLRQAQREGNREQAAEALRDAGRVCDDVACTSMNASSARLAQILYKRANDVSKNSSSIPSGLDDALQFQLLQSSNPTKTEVELSEWVKEASARITNKLKENGINREQDPTTFAKAFTDVATQLGVTDKGLLTAIQTEAGIENISQMQQMQMA
jgi:hypothetical protein